MNTKKILHILFFVMLPFVLMAQGGKNNTDAYVLEPGKPQQIPVVLQGPDYECYPIKLMLEASYVQKNDMVSVTIHSQFEKVGWPWQRYTHLWCPIFSKGEFVYYMILDKYIMRELNCYLEKGVKLMTQVRKAGRESFKFENSFQCTNGELSMPWDSDVMFPLSDEQPLTLNIAVKDINAPVQLTLHNIVAAKQKTIFQKWRKILSLKYITEDVTVSFVIPESNCFGMQEQIQRYRKLNADLQKDYQELVSYMKSKSTTSGGCKECDARRMMVLEKYSSAKQDIRETQCRELAMEYDDFNKFYGWLGDGLVTPDSLRKMIAEMDQLIDDISLAKNSGNAKKCKQLKEISKKYSGVKVDADMFGEQSEMKNTVKMFMERRVLLENLRCGPEGYTGSCRIDTDKIKKATSKINKLLNDYLVRKARNEKEFVVIVKETDDYLGKFSESCKKNKKYSSVIEQYLGAKKAYKDAVK